MITYKETLEMGFRESHTGTKMLRYAANYVVEQQQASPAWHAMVTKNIYPEVARVFGTTCPRVERNIRAAVKAAGYDMTNSEAIAQLAEMAKEVGGDEDGLSAGT